MVTHSNILGSEIPWTAEPGGLQSIWLQRVGRNVVTKQQQQLHNSLPCLVGCRLWGHTESDTTEAT